jgi:hypothetical protein
MTPGRDVSIQELLEHLDAIKNANGLQAANEIRDNLQELGIYDLLLDAEEKYQEFWNHLGEIKVIEMFEQTDLDSKEINSAEGKEIFSLESKPYLNQQSNEFKAFAAWHLHNTQSGTNDPVFSPEQLRGMADRSYSQLEEEIQFEDSDNVLADPETAGEDLKVNVRSNILRLLDVIETLRVLDVEMPAQVISCFLFVASRPDGCTTAEMQEELGLTAASMSRNTTWLTGQHRSNPDRGLNLITKEVYEPNKRLRYLRLTQHGRNLAKQLSELLNQC